ncbi:MAG: ACP S-malonyltransferase [Treponema sp.]|jgi:[acyl-carrier-protein] S-malonyltransferase|nr:ACP S-malonyltransferase [Treponema sp.]
MNKNKVVYLFPGQGAQSQGMALDFLSCAGNSVAKCDAVKELFAKASEIFGKDMEALLRDSDADTLKRTDVAQPAITLANLAAAAYLGEQGYSPAACAGFSLGEYAALVYSGVISAADCFRLIKARSEAMQKSADKLRDAAGGDASAAPGMAAIVGLAPEQVESLIAQWSAAGLKDLYAANINSPKQLVVSGTAAALTEAETRFKEAGAKRVIRLQVAGPFHSPLIADAAEAFRPALEAVTFSDPSIPLFSNVTGKQVTSGAEAKKLALAQITSPVRWVEEEAAVAALGIEACLEVGPGKVLQGLWKDSGSSIPCFIAGTVEDISKIGEGV